MQIEDAKQLSATKNAFSVSCKRKLLTLQGRPHALADDGAIRTFDGKPRLA